MVSPLKSLMLFNHPLVISREKFLPEHAMLNMAGSKWLYEEAARIGPDGLVIEVGTWCGWSATVLALGGPKTICVDTFLMSDAWVKGPAKQFRERGRNGTLDIHTSYLIELGLSQRIATVQARSLYAAKAMGKEIADLIFLDADHAYQAVVDDMLAWEPVLKPGGILCGDNWQTIKNVRKAVLHVWETKFKRRAWLEPQRVASDVWAMRKPMKKRKK